MKIRILSDIHLEFGDYFVEPLPDDKETVLVLAGDITVAASRVSKNVFLPFIERCYEQFYHVVMIMGNHEHYHGDIYKSKGLLKSLLYDNHLEHGVSLLENETVCIEGVAFIGATLWTDCSLTGEAMSPKAEYLWNGMTDSKIVAVDGKKMTAYHSKHIFDTSKKYIFSAIKYWQELGYETVVISHHCPSSKSTHDQYSGQDFNMFFVSQMDLDIAEANPDIWIHGHTHHAFNYMLDESICNTRVICNPRGYHGSDSLPESRGFNPLLTIEV